MIKINLPQPKIKKVENFTCEFHKQHPNKFYPDCDCRTYYFFEYPEIEDEFCSDCDVLKSPKCNKCLGC